MLMSQRPHLTHIEEQLGSRWISAVGDALTRHVRSRAGTRQEKIGELNQTHKAPECA